MTEWAPLGTRRRRMRPVSHTVGRLAAVVVAVLVAGAGLGACGDDDAADVGAGDDAAPLLSEAIADHVVVEGGSPFEGDPAAAECFANGVVQSVGPSRLTELGFAVDAVPDGLHAEWTAAEVDLLVEQVGDCADVGALTATAVEAITGGEAVECVVAEIGERFSLEVLRAELAAGPDEAAIQAAVAAASEPVGAALEACRARAAGDDSDQPAAGFDPDPLELVDGPAPLGLSRAALPESREDVDAVFAALPSEFVGGLLELESGADGVVAAVYGSTERTCAPPVLQAVDLAALPEGMFPAGWTAEWEVARFATGADWDVEASGRDGDLVWVQWHTTCGGEGVDDAEVHVTDWGTEGATWVFTASATDSAARDALVAAFVAAAPQRERRDDTDHRLARQALLRRGELGPDWVSQPRIDEEDDPVGDELAEAVFEAEPACGALVERATQEGTPVSEILDAVAAGTPGRAESPTYLSTLDGTSEVEHTVSVYASPAEVTEAFALMREMDWSGCVRAVFDDLLRARYDAEGVDVTIADYSATEAPVAVGDDGARIRITVTIEPPQGTPAEFTFDLSAVATGRAVSAVSQLSVDGAIADLDAVATLAHRKAEGVFG